MPRACASQRVGGETRLRLRRGCNGSFSTLSGCTDQILRFHRFCLASVLAWTCYRGCLANTRARLNWLLDVFKSIPNSSAPLYPSITYMLNTIPYPLGNCAMAVANSSRVKSNSLNASKSAGLHEPHPHRAEKRVLVPAVARNRGVDDSPQPTFETVVLTERLDVAEHLDPGLFKNVFRVSPAAAYRAPRQTSWG